ncbi:MAG: hypothetical protein QM790_04405 [Nibricoccus sp.]
MAALAVDHRPQAILQHTHGLPRATATRMRPKRQSARERRAVRFSEEAKKEVIACK